MQVMSVIALPVCPLVCQQKHLAFVCIQQKRFSGCSHAHADAIRAVVREALNEGGEHRSVSGDVDRLAERNSMDTEDSLENDYLSW